ncbi:MAG: hypothetical protein RL499_1006, partial [Actinomycetota bacterium]
TTVAEKVVAVLAGATPELKPPSA